MADDGLTLPSSGHPRRKHDYAGMQQAVQSGETKPDGILSWEHEFADVSTAGDLGYRWGRYIYTYYDSTQAPRYYVTIWKKQKDGAWRFVFDAGNQLVAEETQ